MDPLRYHVTTRLDDRTIEFQHRIADPFVRQTVTLGWRDLLRGLLRRRLAVTVLVDGDRDAVDAFFRQESSGDLMAVADAVAEPRPVRVVADGPAQLYVASSGRDDWRYIGTTDGAGEPG